MVQNKHIEIAKLIKIYLSRIDWEPGARVESQTRHEL